MERLLADLLPACNDREEVGVLHLHTRLQKIYARQAGLQASRRHLTALRS